MKRLFKVLITTCLLLSLCACAKTNKNKDKISVVVSIYPIYDWVENIIKDVNSDVDVYLLIDSGSDLHNYQPSVKDIATISKCDLFIYVGGESDDWVDDALRNKLNENLISINLLEELGDLAKEEELVEGMEGEEEEEEEEEEESEEEEIEYDEHVWLSLKNAVLFVNKISSSLSSIDEKNKDKYSSNANEYVSKLNELDSRYQDAINNKNKDTILFGDRFPFRYLVSDYNLKYYAAFIGCSAETEASFETIAFLSNKVDELGLKVILKIEGSDGRIASTIKDNTRSKDQQILTMNSLQSLTLNDYKNGVTYLKVMEDNLSTLIEALK